MAVQLSIDFGKAEVISLPMPKAKVRVSRPSSNDCLTSEELKERIYNASNRVGQGICAKCPLVQVCSDECGSNPSNGYRPGRISHVPHWVKL